MAYKWYIIDGYNVMHQTNIYEDNNSLEDARDRLIDDMLNYQGYLNAKISLIFDGSGKAGSKSKNKKKHKGNKNKKNTFEILFSSGNLQADNIIEELVYNTTDKNELCVVSSDRTIKMMVFGMGAHTMSANEFLNNIKEETNQSKLTQQTKKNFLENRISF